MESSLLGAIRMDEQARTQSIPQQIKTCVLNMTVGQWMRAVDMVLTEYTPRSGTVEEEADYVVKLALLVMMTRWYDEQDICLLLDSTSFEIPRRLAETDKFTLTKILDRPPSGEGMIEDYTDPDPHAMPRHQDDSDGGPDLSLLIPPY